MTKNDIVNLEITSLTSEGSGVGRHDGMAVFVPFTAVGDIIRCRIVKALKNYAFGKIEEIITPSPDRTDSRCSVFGKCGGCVFRHITYEAELRAKEQIVRDAFERLGKNLAPEFLPIIGSERSEGYRNKLQMPLARCESGAYCGFFATRSHRVIGVERCLLQPDIFAEITRFVTEYINKRHISVYSEEKHEGVLRHIFLRKGHYSDEICLCIVARKKIPEFSGLAESVTKNFPQITGVVLNINSEKTNVILGDKEIVLKGRAEIYDTMCGMNVAISPKSFYQVNTPAAEQLYKQAAEFAQPCGKVLLDLYCGAGTIGLSMAREATRVIGAEIVPEAVENAKRSAEKNGLSNTEFICADAGQAADALAEKGLNPDVIILDPPRKGCNEETLAACAKMSPERIVMISCNPATAARDCERLLELGYKTEKVRAFDLFPRTGHVECVVSMSRKAE